MKINILLLFFLATSTMFGQKVYTSQATQHFPSSNEELIDRVITIDEEKITIKSVASTGKVKIRTLFINNKVTNYDEGNVFLVYECLARNGRTPTTVIIPKEKPRFITLLEPSLTDAGQMKEYKLLLD